MPTYLLHIFTADLIFTSYADLYGYNDRVVKTESKCHVPPGIWNKVDTSNNNVFNDKKQREHGNRDLTWRSDAHK